MVLPAVSADLKFSVPHLSFNGQPLDTKTNTPIYSVCRPTTGTTPCATAPTSTGVRVLVRDAFGNNVADNTGVTIGINTAVLGLGTATTTSGVADFGNGLTINALGSRTLSARAAAIVAASDESASFRLVNDLKACGNTKCETKFGVTNQNFINVINAGNGQFDTGGRNVILRSQGQVAGDFSCAGAAYLGSGSEAVTQGTGSVDSKPKTTMVLIISKDYIKSQGLTSRNAASFNACVGATFIGPGTEAAWTTKTGTPAAQKVTGVWYGIADDCTKFAANSANPCVALKTKQVADVQAYLNGLGYTINVSQFMKDSDLAIVIRKASPWDGKGIILK